MPKIAVIIPSRGLIYSQTIDEALVALHGYDYQIFWSHGNPIPDCFNIPTEKALKDKTFTHFMFIEEDMVVPKDCVEKLLKYPVAAYDYPYLPPRVNHCATRDIKGDAICAGTGVFMIQRQYLDAMPKPLFRTDILWDIKMRWGQVMFEPNTQNDATYGIQDVNFCLRLYFNGHRVKLVGDTGHRKVSGDRQEYTNKGVYAWEGNFGVTPKVAYSDEEYEPLFNLNGKMTFLAKGSEAAKVLPQFGKYFEDTTVRFVNYGGVEDWLTMKPIDIQ